MYNKHTKYSAGGNFGGGGEIEAEESRRQKQSRCLISYKHSHACGHATPETAQKSGIVLCKCKYPLCSREVS